MDREMNDLLKDEAEELPRREETQTETEEWALPQYQPQSVFDLKKGDTVFAICALVASIFTAVLGIFGGFALGYLISVVLMTALFIIYFAKSGKPGILPIVCGVLSLANGAVCILTTNVSVRLFGVLISILLSLVCFDGMVNGKTKGNRQTLGIFYSAVSTVGNISVAVRSLFSNGDGGKKAIGKVIVGLLCAIPVLAVVVPLLLSSDDAFRGMMTELFSNSTNTLLKSVLGVFISLFVISYGFSLKACRVSKPKQGEFAGIENVYIISFLSAIGVCYLLYLFSQLAYFFSAFKGFLPDGDITYAEYARKGFFEMCVIAVINLFIVFVALLIAKKQNGRVCHGIKAVATFIAVFTLIIIATAISKMVLYIGVYGMTVLRLTTSAFMLFLGVVFISVIMRIYIIRINIIKISLITAGCIVFILGAANVDAVCAKYNYESYKSGKLQSIDIDALYGLGDEGIPYIVKLADSQESAVALQAKKYLAKAYLYDYFDDMQTADDFTVDDLKQNRKNKGFEHFSIPESAAYDSLYDYLEEFPQFGSKCRELLNTQNKSNVRK